MFTLQPLLLWGWKYCKMMRHVQGLWQKRSRRTWRHCKHTQHRRKSKGKPSASLHVPSLNIKHESYPHVTTEQSAETWRIKCPFPVTTWCNNFHPIWLPEATSAPHFITSWLINETTQTCPTREADFEFQSAPTRRSIQTTVSRSVSRPNTTSRAAQPETREHSG